MNSFEWIDATSVEQAASLLAGGSTDRPVVAKAGGIDIVDLMKEGIVRPWRVVNLKSIGGLDGIRFDAESGLTLGALATLAHIESAPDIRRWYPALSAAAGHASTPQVRNVATIGGNLLQRPRCWYFRSQLFHREEMNANEAIRDGENQYHAIFDNDESAMVHASTPATALVAYGALVQLTSAKGRTRTVPLTEFLLPPDISHDRDTTIDRDELLTSVIVPPPGPGTRAAYHKQTERESYDWPICDVAVVLRMTAETVDSASIVIGWVAPTPHRAVESERSLIGGRVNEERVARAAATAVARATPLSKNQYKVPIVEVVVRRTIVAAASG
jgi:xanthine dehydrogenase YagS FAD-binding subunit